LNKLHGRRRDAEETQKRRRKDAESAFCERSDSAFSASAAILPLESSLKLRFEKALESDFPASDRSLANRAMRHALFPGGKRIRPLLSLFAYHACHGKTDSAILPFACAIELVHNFSLIQDDLPCMDNDHERRGKPTLHIAFGEALGLLAADALFARAFELCTESSAPAARIVQATRELARVAGTEGIVTGQVQDLGLDDRGNSKCRMQNAKCKMTRIESTHRLKTASLIGASLKIGAVIAGAKPWTVAALYQAGLDLGMLFQLTDDLLDRAQETTGVSYSAVFGRRGAEQRAARYLKSYESGLARIRHELEPRYVVLLLEQGRRVLNRIES
jgi:geranylgeranyl pyrophosphate synthase